MRLDLSNPYLFYWLLNFIHVAANKNVLDNCFYDDQYTKTSFLPSLLLESKKMFLAQVVVSVMEQMLVILH